MCSIDCLHYRKATLHHRLRQGSMLIRMLMISCSQWDSGHMHCSQEDQQQRDSRMVFPFMFFFTFQQSFHRVTTHAQATAHNFVHVYNPSPVTASVPSLVHVVKLAFQPKAFDKPVYGHT